MSLLGEFPCVIQKMCQDTVYGRGMRMHREVVGYIGGESGLYTFMICSSANDIEAKATAKVKAWTKKVNNVVKPNVKLNLLKR